ncbi:LpqB family beta-propeller domain-containing protein [Saccharopolyspora mangrovi]|uniref:LpqB family beta-propeller domain-containing protein n=1 Tax=Saccharopolyspora mangrovi TaxID=3082379 RepID=A0ABU6A9C6_9PSEU|nr:LpqB family beta-propeller domain-containing protein [Saccharopolyspora sp. S2-29]MEB3368182.1 LpqB family beta-propeller domain-containing protein [Saccharopolyspora sp. S2-29]
MGAHRSRRLAALLVLLLSVSACASIPESSEPKAVKEVDGSNTTTPINPPPDDIDPLALVRSFVDKAASPASNHESARKHLAPAIERNWTPPPGMLIVENVDTIPATPPQPLPEGVQLVTLRADRVGRLLADSSFVPESGELTVDVRVERQGNGQWRITNPPQEMVVSKTSFSGIFRPVPVYFLDHDLTGVAPDLRYVVSQPASTMPRRVIDLLTSGPSEGMRQAMRTAIPQGVHPKTNTSEAADGALEVNLSQLGEVTPDTRRLIAAQIVYTLEGVSSARVRIKEEGMPLLSDGKDLRPTDLVNYETDNLQRPDLPGLAVVDERVLVLDRQARPISGPAGSGEYDVVRAGRSPHGDKLSAVTRRPGGVALRVGDFGEQLAEMPTVGNYMSKPTWRGEEETWTVVDGRDVVRVVDTGGEWTPQTVDTRALPPGRPITDLRLSRDGTRAAAVIDGHVVIAGIAEQDGHAVLQRPVVLRAPQDTRVTGVEWRQDESLVAITDSNNFPVFDLSVDGFRWEPYTTANLGQPLTAVTVGPGGQVVVADRHGIWQAQDTDDVWSLMDAPIGGASIPFYPG